MEYTLYNWSNFNQSQDYYSYYDSSSTDTYLNPFDVPYLGTTLIVCYCIVFVTCFVGKCAFLPPYKVYYSILVNYNNDNIIISSPKMSNQGTTPMVCQYFAFSV